MAGFPLMKELEANFSSRRAFAFGCQTFVKFTHSPDGAVEHHDVVVSKLMETIQGYHKRAMIEIVVRYILPLNINLLISITTF